MSDRDTLAIESKKLVQSFYDSYLCEDTLIQEMEENGCKNKKSDKQDFVSLIGNVLSEKIQSIVNEKTEEYSNKLVDYLENYSKGLNYEGKSDIEVEFDVTNAFALGVSALGVLGASATWLATSFTATIVTLFPELAGIGMFAAFGGMVAIAIGGIVAATIALVKAITWKKNLAKSIIDAYQKEKYLENVLEIIDKYWDDTKISVNAGTKKVEEEWAKKIKEYESLADEKNIPVIAKRVSTLTQGLDFFEQMPLPSK